MDDLAFWRNIALVFLLIQLFVGVLLAVALSYVLVRLTSILQGHTERAARKAQAITRTVAEQTDVYSRKAIEPVIAVRSKSARVSRTVRTLLGREPTRGSGRGAGSSGNADRTGASS